MSRPWIYAIICCLFFVSSTAIGWSQEYLDLPDEPTEQTTSLADRLASLRSKFRRKPKPEQQSESSAPRTRPTTPRYRNTAQASLQSQQRARRLSNQSQANQRLITESQVAPKQVVAGQTKPRVTPIRTRENNEVVARPRTADLLPDTQLFSRSRQPLPRSIESNAIQPKTKQFTAATSVPRAGSKSTMPKVARLSPATSRANELDAALADLLKAKQPETTKVAVKPSALKSTTTKPKLTKSESKVTTQSVVSNTFDLRKALLEDEAKKIAQPTSETATAEAEKDSKEITAQVAKVAAPKNEEPLLGLADNAATEVVEQPTANEIEKPVLIAKPKAIAVPAIVAEPVIIQQQPVAQQPLIINHPVIASPTTQPIVLDTKPRQAITIAPARPSPKLSQTRESVSDPFESSKTSAYNTEQSSANPMREFKPEFESEPSEQSFARPQTSILQTTQQPVIVSHVEGPRSILVGREATYQVTLENTSTSAAENLSAEITVPEWAELVDAMSTSGVVERRNEGANAGALEWKLSDLPARSSQALRLRLIPRSGRPLQIGVRWSQAPVQSQAVVEVQEPKLELAISGPQEVRFGKPQRYRLTLRNPGTGTTEAVSLRLVPPGGDSQSATTQKIGNLKAGEVRDIDLELTAREAGELLIQADAVADGGLKAETTKAVLCRKPELQVDWRGPDKKYAGTVAAYYFRVTNPGTADTDPVDMTVKLPAGTEFVSASEGFSINTATGTVNWSLASLDAGEEQFMQLRCKIARPGSNDFLVTAESADSDLKDSKAFQTEVVALADLKLEVSDPQGPLPLSEAVVYEIRVRNRGTTGAEHINIVGLFSEGIEPTTVEGAQYTVRDGRVSFHPIKSLPAGREVVLRIHADATQAGTHIFRTEVTCPKLDIKLAAEETTRFFEEEHSWENGKTPYMAERESASAR